MLPTPAKFHYVFNLRDLSRIWEGMLNATNEGVNDAKTLLNLWKHECTRVIADRFTNHDDKAWFEKAIKSTLEEQMEESDAAQVVDAEPFFVDFLRCACKTRIHIVYPNEKIFQILIDICNKNCIIVIGKL